MPDLGSPELRRSGQPLSDTGRPQVRGHHKIFLGMAAGVGKTYRMLQEEVVPRSRVTYRGVALEEMDVRAILVRNSAHGAAALVICGHNLRGA